MTLTFDHEQYCIECRKRKKSPINKYFCEECYKDFIIGNESITLTNRDDYGIMGYESESKEES